MCVRVHVHVSECTQRPTINVWCLPRSLSTLYWRQNLSLKLKLTDPATLTDQQAHGPSFSALPVLGLVILYHGWILHRCWELN